MALNADVRPAHIIGEDLSFRSPSSRSEAKSHPNGCGSSSLLEGAI